MKYLVAILYIALMIQISLAQTNEGNDFIADIEETLRRAKEMLEKTEGIVKDTIKDLRKTPDFVQVNDNVRQYLVLLDNYKIVPGNCISKTSELLQSYLALVDLEEEEEGSETSIDIAVLITERAGEEFNTEMREILETVDYMPTNIDEEMRSAQFENSLELFELVIKTC